MKLGTFKLIIMFTFGYVETSWGEVPIRLLTLKDRALIEFLIDQGWGGGCQPFLSSILATSR